MTRCWALRTDQQRRTFFWSELQAGRLRQGWGYRPDLDLAHLADLRRRGVRLPKYQQDAWRGNRRLLPSQPDAMQVGDIVVFLHLPRSGVWSIARVTGGTRPSRRRTSLTHHGGANRCLLTNAEPACRVDQGAQPIPDWDWVAVGAQWVAVARVVRPWRRRPAPLSTRPRSEVQTALAPRCHQCRRHHGRLQITASKPLAIEDKGTPRGCDRRRRGPARPR